MAKIKFGMMMTDARGKLGGQVFSKNRAGAYVRTKVTPGNPQSVFQSIVRTLFATISAAWSALTDAQRAAWNSAVEDWQTTNVFGDSIKPSGKNLHHRLNQNAQLAGFPAIETPPAKADVPGAIVTSGEINITRNVIELDGIFTGADAKVIIEATPVLSDGTRFVKNRLRQIFVSDADDILVQSGSFTAYVSRFGLPSVGDNIFLGVKYVLENGQTSVRQIIKASVAED